MKKILLILRKRLYVFVAIVFVLALVVGTNFDMSVINIKAISMVAVFLMLYPMLTGLVVEKVKKAGRNYKLISLTLFFAFFMASGVAFILSRTVFASMPELALGIILVGAIPCSNMLIGWTGIAEASVEDALVVAVIGLMLIPVISPIIVIYLGGPIIDINPLDLFKNLSIFIFAPMVLGYFTRKQIIKKKGMPYFMDIKQYFPNVSALGILVIIFFSVSKVANEVIENPMVFLQVAGGLSIYYLVQTVLAVGAAKIFKLNYSQGMILILGATASSQAISLAIAASMFGGMTVFALSFKPMLQVLYIMFLIYVMGPKIKQFLGE